MMPEATATPQAKRRDFVVVSTTQFFLAFALNFMLVFLPIYVHRISTLEEAATLRWIGLIMGAAPAMAAAFGFRGAFLASGLMLFVVCLFCQLALSRIPPRPKPSVAGAIPRRQSDWPGSYPWGTMHIIFLPSILPTILRGFEVPKLRGLVTAGTIVFAYGIAAVQGPTVSADWPGESRRRVWSWPPRWAPRSAKCSSISGAPLPSAPDTFAQSGRAEIGASPPLI